MTFEELRVTYQCPEQMARDLFAQLAACQALHTMEQALRAKAENKLAAAAAPHIPTRRGEMMSHESNSPVSMDDVARYFGVPVSLLQPAAPTALSNAEMIAALTEVHSWARDLPIPTRGACSAMQKVRAVRDALAAAPVAAQAGQVAPAQPLAMVSPDELRDIQAGRGAVPVRGNQWRDDQVVPIYAAAVAGQVAVPEDVRKALQTIARWDLPATGKTWPSGGAVSYEAEYGSNGARDYMRQVALNALAALDVPPAVAQQALADWISIEETEPPERELIALRYWPYDNRENPQAVTGGRYVNGTFYNDEGDELHPPSHWCRLPHFDAEATAQASTPDVRSQEGGAA